MPQDHGLGPTASCRVASGRPGETDKNKRDDTVLPEPTCDRRILGRLSRPDGSAVVDRGALGDARRCLFRLGSAKRPIRSLRSYGRGTPPP